MKKLFIGLMLFSSLTTVADVPKKYQHCSYELTVKGVTLKKSFDWSGTENELLLRLGYLENLSSDGPTYKTLEIKVSQINKYTPLPKIPRVVPGKRFQKDKIEFRTNPLSIVTTRANGLEKELFSLEVIEVDSLAYKTTLLKKVGFGESFHNVTGDNIKGGLDNDNIKVF